MYNQKKKYMVADNTFWMVTERAQNEILFM